MGVKGGMGVRRGKEVNSVLGNPAICDCTVEGKLLEETNLSNSVLYPQL